MNTANRVIKNTGFLYAKMGITMFISLYTTRLILNALGAEDFGVFNIVGGAIAMLGFLNAAMAGSTQRFMSYTEGEGNKEKQKSIFNISVILHIAIALIMAIVLAIAGYFFFNGILNISPERMYAAKIVYASLIISTVFTVMTVPYDAVLNAHENMLYYSIVGIIESVLKLAVALLVVVFGGDKLVIYGVLMAVIPLIIITIMGVYSHRKYEECKIAPHRYWNKSLMKEMATFGGWNLVSSSSSIITMQGIALILNNYFGVVANAAHGIANQLNGQLMVFSNNMLKALNPTIVKAEGGNNRSNMLFSATVGNKFSFLLFSLFSIPFIVETPLILRLWLRNVPEYAVLFARLILIRSMISQLYVTFSISIGATGKIKSYILIDSFFWFLPLPISIIIYSLGGHISSIYLLFVVFVFVRLLYSTLFMKKLCGLNINSYLYDVVFKCVLTAFLSFGLSLIVRFFIDQSIFELFLVIFTASASFIIFFYIIVLNNSEKLIIKDLIKISFKKKNTIL